MPFNRPTLPDLIDRAVNDIEARLPGVDARLRRSNLNVLAQVQAAGIHGLYGYLEYLARQMLPDTAEVEFLDRMATLWLPQPRKAATAAAGVVTFTGTNGSAVPVGTVLSRADGAEYTTNTEVIVTSGTATVAITAVLAGVAGNHEAGNTTLTLVTPITGIQSSALAGLLTNGADTETDASLRSRIIARIKQAPQGGAAFDYITWALEVPGVTRAWVSAQEMGVGTVTVRFVRDNDVNPIPESAEIAAVQAYIDQRRPVTAQVSVVAPVATPLNFTIAVTPNTTAVRAAVSAELNDLIRREAEPGATLLLSHIREAISIAAGEINYVMTSPAADVTHTIGQMAVMGAITWA